MTFPGKEENENMREIHSSDPEVIKYTQQDNGRNIALVPQPLDSPNDPLVSLRSSIISISFTSLAELLMRIKLELAPIHKIRIFLSVIMLHRLGRTNDAQRQRPHTH